MNKKGNKILAGSISCNFVESIVRSEEKEEKERSVDLDPQGQRGEAGGIQLLLAVITCPGLE